MGIFEHFPYTNFHNLNLDKILERTKEAEEAVTAAVQQVQDAAADMAEANAKATQALANSAAALSLATSVSNNYAPLIISRDNLIDENASNAMVTTVRAYKVGNIIFASIAFMAQSTTASIAIKPEYVFNNNSVIATVFRAGVEDDYTPEVPTVAALTPADFMTYDAATRVFSIRNTISEIWYTLNYIALLS